ncbi:MATE family efflux transporter [Pedobacter nanyangensis]|uniref:MATE family efflux transporter n=1 Tax=Pedobacter nanyangensis TaxID=1562389 RepID=UPI000DE45A3D|nr:MATE family efflux transporter [Pedobacter nanyangensis]
MSQPVEAKSRLSNFFKVLIQAFKGIEIDYTTISIRKAIVLLAVPMMLEMIMESVFVLVDLYFVGHLPNSAEAIQIVGLTESVLTIIYSLAMGLGMAATAVVARRIGEKNTEAASRSGMQTIGLAAAISIIISILGVVFAKDILLLMGATEATAVQGVTFTRIMMGTSMVIMLLFLINGIFRGAGNAAIAMQSLGLANALNIILCPILVRGFGPIPAMGLTGAALATAIGRGTGVLFQVYHLAKGSGALKVKLAYLKPQVDQIKAIVKIAAPAVLQFVIASCSWIFLAELVATTAGKVGSAGFLTALRLMMFFILPAWGLSNAAATLVGQNMGAGRMDRAEKSVFVTIKYAMIFMGMVMVLFLTCGHLFASFFTDDQQIRNVAVEALQIMSYGFILYGVGMVLISAFNGAGDTWTPTKINIVAFWLFQIPFAYFLAKYLGMGPTGVFIAIPVAEVVITVASYLIFKKGKWQKTAV